MTGETREAASKKLQSHVKRGETIQALLLFFKDTGDIFTDQRRAREFSQVLHRVANYV